MGVLRRKSSLALVGVVAQGGFRVATNVVIGRFAGTAVLGQAAGIVAAAQFLTLLGPSSLAAAQTRFVARGAADHPGSVDFGAGVVGHVRRRVLAVGAVLVVFTVCVWGLALRTPPEHVAILVVLTGGLIAYGLTKSHLLGIGRVERMVVSEVATAIAGMLAVGGLIWAGVRDLTLLWPVAATAWMCAALSWVVNRPVALPASTRREVDRFAAIGVVGTLVSAGFLQSSVMVASQLIGGEEAGHYAAAFALATPLSLITISVGMILFPTFSGVSGDAAQSRRLLTRTLRVMVITLVPPLCLLMALSPEVVALVWGEEFGPTALLLPPLICAIGMAGVGMPASQALTSMGVVGMRESTRIGCVGAFAGVSVWALTVPTFGVAGLAVGYALGTSITSALPLVVMGGRLGAPRLLPLIRGWLIPCVVAAISMTLVAQETGPATRAASAAVLLVAWLLVGRFSPDPPVVIRDR